MSKMTVEQIIWETAQKQAATEKSHKRRAKWWLPVVLDVSIAGVILCLFALFHHVLPAAEKPLDPIEPPVVQTPQEPQDTSMGAKFKDKFTDTVVRTENSYSSQNIALSVEKKTMGEGKNLVTYYVADIYIRDVECFQTAFAKDTFGSNIKEDLLDIATRHNAILAISGDYYGMHANKSVIRNGKLYRNKSSDEDVCVLYRDGTMRMFSEGTFDAKKEIQNDAWQAFSFGPSLLKEDGTPRSGFSGYLSQTHPRCAIGYYEPGHYAFVLVDGRKENYSVGMKLEELGSLFQSLGCSAAYNLDGGRTAVMAFGEEVVNQPYKGGRQISDIIFIGEVAQP